MHRNDCEPLSFWQRVSLWLIRARMKLGRWGRSFLRPGSYTVAGFAAVYGVSQLLKVEEIPSSSAWTSDRPLGWLLAMSGIGAIIGTLLVFAGFSRVLKKQEENDELAEACRGLWAFVTETLGLEMNKVGVHVWSVKGLKGFHYLQRRATFVIEQRPSTHVIWWKGKGAIGVAWGGTTTRRSRTSSTCTPAAQREMNSVRSPASNASDSVGESSAEPRITGRSSRFR